MEILAEQEASNIDTLIDMYEEVHQKYPDEFIIFDLWNMATPLFTPFLKRKMLQWRPFDENQYESDDKNFNPRDFLYCFDYYSTLKEVLKNSNYKNGQNSMHPFHRILWETWMPAFRGLLLQKQF